MHIVLTTSTNFIESWHFLLQLYRYRIGDLYCPKYFQHFVHWWHYA